ncbi:MAG: DUF6477 family protein [Pseudomonadota bacterium]
MQDITTMLSQIRRPRLLTAAARHGLAEYDRRKHLKRILGLPTLPAPGAAAIRLMELEAAHDEARRTGDGSYALTRHIDVLIALMGEARLLRVRLSEG